MNQPRYFCKSIGCQAPINPLTLTDFCDSCRSKNPNTVTVPTLLPRTKAPEADPTGKSQHEPGAKVDAGKPRPALVLGGFARALMAVTEIGTFGAVKYTENGWMTVPNGPARYDDAQMRHWLYEKMGITLDPDSSKTHLAHEAWNSLARLDLYLREEERRASSM